VGWAGQGWAGPDQTQKKKKKKKKYLIECHQARREKEIG
jgi:hypothetical protein